MKKEVKVNNMYDYFPTVNPLPVRIDDMFAPLIDIVYEPAFSLTLTAISTC